MCSECASQVKTIMDEPKQKTTIKVKQEIGKENT